MNPLLLKSQGLYIMLLWIAFFIFPISSALAQSHDFPSFNPGTLSSNTSGITTSLDGSALTENYLVYYITVDFMGTGNPAWSNSIQAELNDGGSTIYKELGFASSGAADSPNATTLIWIGIMNREYAGGGNLNVRFFDDYHDASGPYTCSLTNANITLYESKGKHNFATYSPGTLSSATSGITNAMNTVALSSNYLFFTLETDFVGTGNPAWSNSIEAELNDGGSVVYKELGAADFGAMENPNATTLIWTGIMNAEYAGGGNLNVRFFDDYDDASGPYTCSLTNTKLTIYAISTPQIFPVYSPGTITSNTPGVSTAMDVSSVPAGNYLTYTITADFIGIGNSAWSNSIEVEVSDGSGLIYSPSSTAKVGSLENPNATTLTWTGLFNREYSGGSPVTVRFSDNYHDGSGPYTSSISNVNFTLYRDVGISVPVELLSFVAKPISEREVKLDWITLSEINNDFFSIERSQDGKEFSVIGRVEGQGSSSEENIYSWLDTSPFTGENYYRLKQTDFDGRFEYSEVVLINLLPPDAIQTFPNPSKGQFNIVFPSDTNIDKSAIVKNMEGQIIMSLNLETNNHIIDLSNHPNGMYIVYLNGLGKTARLMKY